MARGAPRGCQLARTDHRRRRLARPDQRRSV